MNVVFVEVIGCDEEEHGRVCCTVWSRLLLKCFEGLWGILVARVPWMRHDGSRTAAHARWITL